MSITGPAKILIAMSGGVDSSVAAYMTMTQGPGLECSGVTMRLRENNDDVVSAAGAAAALGIPHIAVDFEDAFEREVITPFARAYEAGITPNPCVRCNAKIKFGLLYNYALNNGFEALVTGHYARIDRSHDIYSLCRALDSKKDQSYFLCGLKQEQLSHLYFPLGGLTKKQVREIASANHIESANRKESQDICFLGDCPSYITFLESRRGEAFLPGNFVDSEGNILGRHSGIAHYTIGQRKGLGIALGRPVFVKEICPASVEIVLAGEESLFINRIRIAEFNWINDSVVLENSSYGAMRAMVMVRYRAKPVLATIEVMEDGRLTAEFDEPVRAPARGQTAALYDGDILIGGGVIDG